MPRPKLSPRRGQKVHIPEDVYAKMILLKPEMRDLQGFTKYGSVSSYITRLIREDLQKVEAEIREMQGEIDDAQTHRQQS